MGDAKSELIEEEKIAANHPIVYESLLPLLRTKPTDLDAYLASVISDVQVEKTKTKAHCHFIALDGNKRPRVKDFARFLGTKIIDYAIPRAEINRALNDAVESGSTAPVVKINQKAKSLFVRSPKSGEGGEVLLSVMAESLLQLPQLFTKMVLKTSTEMHVHGSDAIHVGVNKANGNLALYWGESKIKKNVKKAIKDCFESLSPYLLSPGGSKSVQERDLQLMRDGIEFEDIHLTNALKRYLDPDDSMFKQLEYRGLCLVGFDSETYPTSPNSKEAKQLKNEVEEEFNANISSVRDQVIKQKIHSFDIHIFCLPFPSVDDFRDAFRSELGLKGE